MDVFIAVEFILMLEWINCAVFRCEW